MPMATPVSKATVDASPAMSVGEKEEAIVQFRNRVAYLGVTLMLTLGMVAATGVSASAKGPISGGGNGWVQCSEPDGTFYASSYDYVYFWWTPDYTTDRYGNPYATYIRPYMGEIWLNDPGLRIWDNCGPFTWTNQAQFDGGAYKKTVTYGAGWCNGWGLNYDPNNGFAYSACQAAYYYGIPYSSTYGWGTVKFGATLYPYAGELGAFSGSTGWYAL